MQSLTLTPQRISIREEKTMTKETKNTVSAETIVENLKEFAEALDEI